MSVSSVQSHGMDQPVPMIRSAGIARDSGLAAATVQHQGTGEPRDQVVVSEQARQLAAGRVMPNSNGEVALKLDFRELRKLVSPDESSSN